MAFFSILFPDRRTELQEPVQEPDFFPDLFLDQIVEAVTASRKEHRLEPFFYKPLQDIDSVRYRQEVFRDLGEAGLCANMKFFAENMAALRRYRAYIEQLHSVHHKQGWFLESAIHYCDFVQRLLTDLTAADLSSRGLSAFRTYVAEYVHSVHFSELLSDAVKAKTDLRAIRYCILMKGSSVTVRPYESEPDYTPVVQNVFARFRQSLVKDYRVQFPSRSGMNHVEANILQLVARRNPECFAFLEHFCEKHRDFLDDTIRRFDREIQFYLSYLDHIARIKSSGLMFCLPRMSRESKSIDVLDAFDLALAHKCVSENRAVVCNDFCLQGSERIVVVSGPNQGGKTTFARMFGQLHYLASLGCPVPARDAQLFFCDRIFAHFENQEDVTTLRGKLQDDLVRIFSILQQASSESIIILNEIFTSTAIKDAVFLSEQILRRIDALDALCVCVTFIDELAYLSDRTVSMVGGIDPADPSVRTYKILRRPPDGRAHAASIAEKYRLTYERLMERIPS